MREDEGTDPASRRGIPSSEELEVVSSLLLSTPASSLLLDMPPLHKGTGHVAEGTRHAAEGTRYAAEGTRGRPIVFRGRPIVLRAKQWASQNNGPPPKKKGPPPRQSAGQSVGQIGGRGQNHKKRVMILEEGALMGSPKRRAAAAGAGGGRARPQGKRQGGNGTHCRVPADTSVSPSTQVYQPADPKVPARGLRVLRQSPSSQAWDTQAEGG